MVKFHNYGMVQVVIGISPFVSPIVYWWVSCFTFRHDASQSLPSGRHAVIVSFPCLVGLLGSGIRVSACFHTFALRILLCNQQLHDDCNYQLAWTISAPTIIVLFIGVKFYKAARLEPPPTFQTPRLSGFWAPPPTFCHMQCLLWSCLLWSTEQ